MLEHIEFAAVIAGVAFAIVRFWNLPDRMDKLENKLETELGDLKETVQGLNTHLARIEGHLFGTAAARE